MISNTRTYRYTDIGDLFAFENIKHVWVEYNLKHQKTPAVYNVSTGTCNSNIYV